MRGDAGPEGLADVSITLPDGHIPDKVRCHNAVVTDVTDKAGQDVIGHSPLFRLQNI
jgi:hypothetical protein